MLVPDHETAVDFLNYEAIAETVIRLLKDQRPHALTVGIHGDWGAGKSSVLKMVEEGIALDNRASCLWFNGWAFQGFDDAKTVLIEATIAEVCRQKSNVGKVKEIGSRLVKRVDWLKAARRSSGLAFNFLTGLPAPDQVGSVIEGLKSLSEKAGDMSGQDLEQGITSLATYLKSAEGSNVPEQIHHFREDFEALLREAKIDQLVVLIDDLDRCLPETAINTLEAIRLFLFVPNTAFVIGADEAMIEYAVRQHFPDLPVASGPLPYSRNYLEKLIQVPFRLPALGTHETKIYVTLLLLESVLGSDHPGFENLIKEAREALNQPWLGRGLSSEGVKRADPERQDELEATYILAQQIGPTLAEGTGGNPRQIKRFINAMHIRQAIAEARGFGDRIHKPALAKLMLAERFQPDFYEHLARRAVASEDGAVQDLLLLEQGGRLGRENGPDEDTMSAPSAAEVERWLERDWLQRWLKLQPNLGSLDLRPYIFVARDKRVLSTGTGQSSLEDLIDRLCGSKMAARMAEPEVRALQETEAERVFNALRERVLGSSTYRTEPPGFVGASLVAKHHQKFQQDLLGILSGVEARELGIWVVSGWNEILSDEGAKADLRRLLIKWSKQEENPLLKRTAGKALGATREGGK